MLLSEIFNTSSKIVWDSHGEPSADFEINGKPYTITFDKPLKSWLMAHTIGDGPIKLPAGVSAKDVELWDVEFVLHKDDHSTAGKTGTGDAAAVLSTAIKAIKEFKSKHADAVFMFSAKEDNRIALYDKITKRLAGSVQSFEEDGKKTYIVGL